MLGADDTVFGDKGGEGAEVTEQTGGAPLSDAEIQELWLRRVQTRPADFLKAKFAYQQVLREEEGR